MNIPVDSTINNAANNEFVCPSCKHRLEPGVDSLSCAQCGVSYPVNSGIPCFAGNTSAWSIPDKNSSGTILDNARLLGWEQSLKDMDPDRADWISGRKRFPLSILCSPKGRALDCGCGWGGLTFWLSREFDDTYALDTQIDGLHFINIRAAQNKNKNVHAVQGSILSMPFEDKFFDVVVLNGVLEWIGTITDNEPPETLQKKALLEIKRVLKPDGTLCLAIENRFGLQYFLGYNEEHTGLRFVSILPRHVARIYHRIIKKNEFRAITHSRHALLKLLDECGLKQTLCFGVHPSYRNARYLISLHGPGAIHFLFASILSSSFNTASWFSNLPDKIRTISVTLMNLAASFFSPSWIIMASESNPPLIGIRKAGSLIKLGDARETGMAVVVTVRNAGIFIVDRHSGKIRRKCSIPISDRARTKAGISQICVEYIRKNSPSLAGHCLYSNVYETGHGPITLTDAVPGRQLNIKKRHCVRSLVHIMGMFGELNVKSEDMPSIFEKIDIRENLADIVRENGLSPELHSFLQKSQIIHGDLNSGNIIVYKEEDKIILLDFEHARIGPAVLNWYDFLLRNLVINARRHPMQGAVVIKRLEKLSRNAAYIDCTKAILEKFGVPHDLHGQFIALYIGWLFRDKITNDPDKVMDDVKGMKFRLS